jgi:signal peptidase I
MTIEPAPRTPRKTRRGVRKLLRDAVSLFAFMGVALTARASFADHYVVPTGSMIPTVQEGDRVVVSKAAYGLRIPMSRAWVFRWSEPARGDVVVLESPVDATILLKRVVAVPGDKISVRNGRLILNGKAVESTDSQEHLGDHSHALSLQDGGGPDFGPATVPPGKVLVMGDNRGNSRDGRSFGWVDVSSVLGEAIGVYARDGSLVWQDL